MITLRDAKPEDAPALARLLGAWVADTPWMPKLHNAEQDLGFLRHLIATQDVRMSDAPAEGFLARDGAAIIQLQVAQRARRRGIGQALVHEAQTRTRHLTLWTHQANLSAIAFWHAMGFKETARTDGRDSEENLPDIRFDWTAP
jgi:GNAT superfamily N-acetyltransferase